MAVVIIRMQAITADTVIAYITHDDRPNIASASNRHGAKQRGDRSHCIVANGVGR